MWTYRRPVRSRQPRRKLFSQLFTPARLGGPYVVASAKGAVTLSTSHPLTRPTGHQADDIILYCIAFETSTSIADWSTATELLNFYDAADPGRDVDMFVGVEQLSGGEGSTLTLTSGSARDSVWASFLVRNGSLSIEHNPSVDEEQDFLGSSITCPSLTPSWGAEDTLWFAIFGHATPATTLVSWPAGYERGEYSSGVACDASIGIAHLERNTATESPTPFAISSSEEYVRSTFAVRKPVSAADPLLGILSLLGVGR